MSTNQAFVWLASLALALQGCAATSGPRSVGTPAAVGPAADPLPTVRVVFRDGKVFAREGAREWPIAEVGRDQMLWAPDGQRFAYLKQNEAPATSRPTASAEPPISRGARVRTDAPVASRGAVASQDPPTFHIVIRNIRGDSVNEFPVYRPGRPTDLDWIDNNTLGYLAPPDETGDVYVLHSARTSEILRIHRGARFVWSPGRRQLAYVANPNQDQLVKVDDNVVWPRGAVERTPAKHPGKKRRKRRAPPPRKIEGELVWSPDGSGLAFLTLADNKPRLVVLLVVDNPGGDLSWPLPDTALLPGNHLFWGESKVVIGESMLKPRFAASWKRIR